MRADLILTNINLIKIMISLLLLQNLIKFHNKLEELNKIKAMLKNVKQNKLVLIRLLTYITNYKLETIKYYKL